MTLAIICRVDLVVASMIAEKRTDIQNSVDFFSKGGGLFLRGGEMVSHGDFTVK